MLQVFLEGRIVSAGGSGRRIFQGTVDTSLARFDEIAGGSGCHVGKSRDTSRRGGSAGVRREADINRRQSGLVVRGCEGVVLQFLWA